MGFDLSGKRVAVLGAGKMGGILLKALLEKGLLSPKLTFATVHHEERARALAEKLGVSVGPDNLAAVRDAVGIEISRAAVERSGDALDSRIIERPAVGPGAGCHSFVLLRRVDVPEGGMEGRLRRGGR